MRLGPRRGRPRGLGLVLGLGAQGAVGWGGGRVRWGIRIRTTQIGIRITTTGGSLCQC